MRFACEIPAPDGAAGRFAFSLRDQLPTIVTDRLVLRAPRVEDFETFAEIACSERGTYFGGPMSREDAWLDFAQMTATWLLHGHGVWTLGHAGRIAGFVLLGFEPGDEEPELGFMMRATAEGQGLALEAAQAAMRHGFEALGWSTLVSYIDPANTRALALAERLGGVADGRIEDEDGGVSLVYRYRAEGLQ